MNKKSLETFDFKQWDEAFPSFIQEKATDSLETGKVLYFPSLEFPLNQQELQFLTPVIVNPRSKNISYDLKRDALGGAIGTSSQKELLKAMLKRYALASRKFLDALIPHYKTHLIQAKTSFRPVEIYGRKTSYRKDDTRLHVDAFPSNPVKGQRILRIFTNINPEGKPRVWRTGERFEDVVRKFAPEAAHPIPGVAALLRLFMITKSYRTPYDHYMLQIHDKMKGDMNYQKTALQEEVAFPAGSSWIVFTDQVSHAAMAGQHVLEQTFYLPSIAVKNRDTAPLAVLEKYFKKQLVS